MHSFRLSDAQEYCEKTGHEVGRHTDGQNRVAHSSPVRFDRSGNGMTGVAFAKIHGGKPVIGWLDLVAAILRTRACLFTCIACVLICDAILARGTLASADGVQSYLEMLSLRSGNTMLRHWVVATDNFLLTDLPGYVLASLVFGRGPFLLAVVPFGVFTLMLVSCLAIVHETVETTGGRRFGCYIVLLLLGVPWGSHFNDFFWSDYHVATIAVCLLAVLAASPVLSGRSIGHWRLASFAIFVFAAAFSDPLADILLSGPLFFVVVVRALAGTGRGLQEMRLAFVVLAATAASFVVRDLSARADLFITATSVTLNPVRSVGQFLSNLSALAVLSGVVMNASSAFVPDASVLPRLIGASRLVTMLLVAATGLHVVWCLPRQRGQGVAQCLVAGAAGITLASATSLNFVRFLPTDWDGPGSPVRFAVPAVIFLALAAALATPPMLIGRSASARRAVYAACLGLAILYGAGGAKFVVGSARQASGLVREPMQAFVEWLDKRGLTRGVGDYWMTQMVNALTQGRVEADAVRNVDDRLVQYQWLTDTGRYVGANPQFVIFFQGSDSGVTPLAIETTFGRPREVVELLPGQFVACLSDCPPREAP